jgi:2-dehydro-3-deoxygluconokinase
MSDSFDVVVLGEVLLEVSTQQALADGVPARLGISGDALNVAAAAAAAGANVALAAVLPTDEIGDALRARVLELGISDRLLRRRPGQQGLYIVHADPGGEREFAYVRGGSVGSTLAPADLDAATLAAAGAVISSGITGAISVSARAAVQFAAAEARRFAYDPNYRPRLTSAASARALLHTLAPGLWLATPSYPRETSLLLGADTARGAVDELRRLGTQNVIVTCGADGVQVAVDAVDRWVPSTPAPAVVDQTGAGDAFLGTFVARTVLGDDAARAARLACSASALVVGAPGGASSIPTLERTVALAGTVT